MRTSKGFTLIELLVVISIIGLLSSVVLASLQSARIKARDTFRKQELVQLRNALEIYFTQNGLYPIGGWYTSNPTGSGGISYNSGNWIPGLVASGAISSLPQDPLSGLSPHPSCTTSSYYRAFYYVSLDGKSYKLLSSCAPEGNVSPTDSFYEPLRPTWAWMVCSGEPACSSY